MVYTVSAASPTSPTRDYGFCSLNGYLIFVTFRVSVSKTGWGYPNNSHYPMLSIMGGRGIETNTPFRLFLLTLT